MPIFGGNFVKETTTTTSTGDYVLGGAVPGFQPFSNVYSDGDLIPLVVTDNAGEYEIEVGTYNAGPNTISRTHVLDWSTANPMNWAAGVKSIYPAISAASTPLVCVAHGANSSDPSTGVDLTQGFDALSLWINPSSGRAWICFDGAVGAAVWYEFLTSNVLRVKEGSNRASGVATLAAGTVTVSNTRITANTRIQLTSQADGGTPGWLRVSARSVGTSFTITSSSGSDTSTVAWLLVEPD